MTQTLWPKWTLAVPLLGSAVAVSAGFGLGQGWGALLLAAALVAGVLAAVHHAEVVAHRVGEPYGTLVLAIAITVIELALIVSLMWSGGPAASVLARDTVFATIMLILNGMVGLCLLVGGSRFGEQSFAQYGVSASLATLATIAVLTLVLPNYTVTTPGPSYSSSQLAFVAAVSLVLYGTFLLVQTVRHRDYFLPPGAAADVETHAQRPSGPVALGSGVLLLVCLVLVVVLAKSLAPLVESAVAAAGAPQALVGVIIAAVVLLPESLAAYRAARSDRIQTSLNLALGSALASIGLTIPAVAVVSLYSGLTLSLGIDAKSIVLLMLSLLVATLSLGTGRTTVLQGVVHLVLLAVYVFTTIVP
jgi:Ca2+:H+ antiporter